jgi:CHAT domain-containing protein
MQTEHSPFPSDETLAAYIDGRLDEETRKRVVEHMAECPECFDSVLGTNEALTSTTTSAKATSDGFRNWRRYALAAAIILSAVPGYILYQRVWINRDWYPSLRDAAPEHRNIEARLTGFPHHPLKPNFRSANKDDDTGNWKVLGVAAEIKDAAKAHPTVNNLHALGVSYLLAGKSSDAVQKLELAIEEDAHELAPIRAVEKTNNARLLNDLAAAYLASAKDDQRPALLVKAIECAERAWDIGRTPEAAWNRALALEALGARDQARGAWLEYLHIDPHSQWSAEASGHLAKLNEPDADKRPLPGNLQTVGPIVVSICESPLQNRQRAEDELFGRWGAAAVAGNTTAARRAAQEIGEIADALADCNGDFLLRDALQSVRIVRSEADRKRLARAHEKFAEATRLYRQRNIDAAATQIAAVLPVFANLNRAFYERGLLSAASCAYYRNDYRACEAGVSPLIERLGQKSQYRSLLAHALWVRASARAALGLVYESIADYRSALAIFEQLGERQNVAGIETLLASRCEDVGDFDAAWTHRLVALQMTANEPPSMSALQLLLQAAEEAARENALAAARVFLDRMLAVSTRPEWRDMRVLALLRRAQVEDSAQQQTVARIDRREAFALAEAIPSNEMRMFTLTSLDYVRAWAADGVHDDSVLDVAIEYARSHDRRLVLPEILTLAAERYARRGERARARSAIEEALHELDLQRERASSVVDREASLAAAGDTYQQAIAAALACGDPEWAFALLERSHVAGRGAQVHSTSEIRAALPHGTAVVEYAVLPESILIWFIRNEHTSFFEQQVRPGEVAAAVREFAATIRSVDRFPSDDDLHRFLIDPWLRDATGIDAIAFVPDAELTEVAFPALHASGAACVERFRITTSISATGLLRRSPISSRAADSLLAVAPGAPAGLNLDDLPAAAREARAIFGMYPRSVLLDAGRASKAKFIDSSRDAAILHYGGHAIDNPRSPAFAALVLRDDNGRPALLYAHEIASLSLDRTRVVILAACSTSAGVEQRAGNLSSLSRAFVTAGASSVIGSLWPIEDAAAAEFSVALHQKLRRGEGAAAALRDVQVSALDRMPPRAWAAFESLGDLGSL